MKETSSAMKSPQKAAATAANSTGFTGMRSTAAVASTTRAGWV